ncbi:MAG: RNA polymerase sigma-70 factor [Tannerella sp.]|jgi:RNA polymerase sigma-70 factor (ECF subfamily)|nr:RNA polymerase sigma-70 factor [Tannerella sp.]
MLNDLAVFKKIKEGDVRTFEKVFRQYYTPLCMYAFSITGRKDIAEEIIQDVFYNIWKEKENIQILRSVKNYLYGAVRNHSLRYQEHLMVQERHQEHVLNDNQETDLSPLELLEYKELENVITNILNKLPERRMQIFRMHRMDGKKYKEIADFYSISVKTVEAEMTKAYHALRQGIEKYYTLNHGI